MRTTLIFTLALFCQSASADDLISVRVKYVEDSDTFLITQLAGSVGPQNLALEGSENELRFASGTGEIVEDLERLKEFLAKRARSALWLPKYSQVPHHLTAMLKPGALVILKGDPAKTENPVFSELAAQDEAIQKMANDNIEAYRQMQESRRNGTFKRPSPKTVKLEFSPEGDLRPVIEDRTGAQGNAELEHAPFEFFETLGSHQSPVERRKANGVLEQRM